ncbi:TPA_asm: hypothetical protein [Altiarchaeum virus]|nr:MAG: hypothetical protein BWK75_01155 [Candidatus Altiarchaeales archaeon A3]DAZ85520.1 TPA_asm: hypothetical protein [Altiarchaeum virus]
MRIEKKEIMLICIFAACLTFLVLVIYPLLNTLNNPVLAYCIFLILWFIFSFLIGAQIKKGLKVALASVIFFLFIDTFTPPLIISWNEPLNVPPHIWGSDLFIYNVLSVTGLPHHILYVSTYIILPTIAVVIMAYLFSPKKTKEMLGGIFKI